MSQMQRTNSRHGNSERQSFDVEEIQHENFSDSIFPFDPLKRPVKHRDRTYLIDCTSFHANLIIDIFFARRARRI